MKRFTLITACALAALAVVAQPAVAADPTPSAQDAQKDKKKAAFRIAVLDVDVIERNAAAIKAIQKQLSGYRKEFESEIQKEEESLRTANQELARKRNLLSEEAFAEERRKFEKRVVDLQLLVRVRKQELERVRVEAYDKVQKKVNEVVSKLADETGITLILDMKAVVYGHMDSLNATPEVLKRLDKEMASVGVTKPKRVTLEEAKAMANASGQGGQVKGAEAGQ